MDREKVRRFYAHMERHPITPLVLITFTFIMLVLSQRQFPWLTLGEWMLSLWVFLIGIEWGRFLEKRKHRNVSN